VCTSTLSRVASLRDLSHFVGEVYEFSCGQRLRSDSIRSIEDAIGSGDAFVQ
jgi:hypothetical protein